MKSMRVELSLAMERNWMAKRFRKLCIAKLQQPSFTYGERSGSASTSSARADIMFSSSAGVPSQNGVNPGNWSGSFHTSNHVTPRVVYRCFTN